MKTIICNFCKQNGLPVVSLRVPVQSKGHTRKVKLSYGFRNGHEVESGDLTIGWLVGPGSPPSRFPGDPTELSYYSSGSHAFVYFHPECAGLSVESYNAYLRLITDQISNSDEYLYI